jgi:hypothetical protein
VGAKIALLYFAATYFDLNGRSRFTSDEQRSNSRGQQQLSGQNSENFPQKTCIKQRLQEKAYFPTKRQFVAKLESYRRQIVGPILQSF